MLTTVLAAACVAAAPGSAALPAWRDVKGKTYGLADVGKSKATVFLFTSTQCPVANLYTPRLLELDRDYGSRGVRFFLIDSNREDDPATVRRYARERAVPFPAVRDDTAALADRLGASATPEAVILDKRAVVRYRGRIDDNPDPARVFRHDVRDALDALLAGKPIARPRTLAFGCAIFHDVPSVTAAAGAVTYARDVAPLLYKSCVSCHRPDEAGPFSLETYQQAKVWAAAIKDYTTRRIMPPWKAVPGHGDFADARALTESEIATLARWADSGAPEGAREDLPPLPKFAPPGQWTLGTPDQVLRPVRAYHLEAEGKDVYREFVLPIDFPEERFLSAVEFKPDNRAVVHHMIVYLDRSGKAAELDGKDREPGYTAPGVGIGVKKAIFVWGWAPGNLPRVLPPGTAYRLSRGAKLVLQVHYHKSGRPEADRSAVGLHFARGPVDREMRVWAAANERFVLTPGVADEKVTAEFTLPTDVHVWSVMPHMHMLGRAMKMTAILPDGATRPMIWVNDWDFNWQESYNYKEPLALPGGTRVRVDALFDNSEKNPRQPSLPPQEVRFGEQTTDEMCIGFFSVTVDREKLGMPGGTTMPR